MKSAYEKALERLNQGETLRSEFKKKVAEERALQREKELEEKRRKSQQELHIELLLAAHGVPKDAELYEEPLKRCDIFSLESAFTGETQGRRFENGFRIPEQWQGQTLSEFEEKLVELLRKYRVRVRLAEMFPEAEVGILKDEVITKQDSDTRSVLDFFVNGDFKQAYAYKCLEIYRRFLGYELREHNVVQRLAILKDDIWRLFPKLRGKERIIYLVGFGCAHKTLPDKIRRARYDLNVTQAYTICSVMDDLVVEIQREFMENPDYTDEMKKLASFNGFAQPLFRDFCRRNQERIMQTLVEDILGCHFKKIDAVFAGNYSTRVAVYKPLTLSFSKEEVEKLSERLLEADYHSHAVAEAIKAKGFEVPQTAEETNAFLKAHYPSEDLSGYLMG